MRKDMVEVGGIYAAKVSGKIQDVKIIGPHHKGGWYAVNVRTNRDVRIRTAARLRYRVN